MRRMDEDEEDDRDAYLQGLRISGTFADEGTFDFWSLLHHKDKRYEPEDLIRSGGVDRHLPTLYDMARAHAPELTQTIKGRMRQADVKIPKGDDSAAALPENRDVPAWKGWGAGHTAVPTKPTPKV